MQGIFLGLANGTACLAYCAPVLIPYLLGEGKNIRQNFAVLGQFLGGRLCGYFILSLLAWASNQLIIKSTGYEELIFSAAYLILAGLLMFYGFIKPATTGVCPARLIESRGLKSILKQPPLFLTTMGFLTGLGLCPPLLLAFTEAASKGSIWQSLLFFFSFFLGTLPYFIPAPFLGVFKDFLPLRTIGRLAAVIVAIYYLYYGAIMFAGGIGN